MVTTQVTVWFDCKVKRLMSGSSFWKSFEFIITNFPPYLQERVPFVVCDIVSWQEFTVALNARWAFSNSVHLNESHLNYLASKLYGGNIILTHLHLLSHTITLTSLIFADCKIAFFVEKSKRFVKEEIKWKLLHPQLRSPESDITFTVFLYLTSFSSYLDFFEIRF